MLVLPCPPYNRASATLNFVALSVSVCVMIAVALSVCVSPSTLPHAFCRMNFVASSHSSGPKTVAPCFLSSLCQNVPPNCNLFS